MNPAYARKVTAFYSYLEEKVFALAGYGQKQPHKAIGNSIEQLCLTLGVWLQNKVAGMSIEPKRIV